MMSLPPEHVSLLERLRAAGSPPDLVSAEPESIPGCGPLIEVARGGQGVVYRTEQFSTRRTVAVKIIADAPYVSPERRSRFHREVEIAAQLRHPNIVTVFDSGLTASGRRYLVMDFVEGHALDVAMSDAGIRRTEMLRVMIKVCDAVNAAHQRGVLHRDLKPGNILVDRSGEPRLLDFGLARQIEAPIDGSDPSALTLTGSITGTLAYMSPEQARGAPADIRSDVYAIGAILYRLLTGAPPHDTSGDVLDALNRIAQHEVSRLEGIDDELDTIVRQAMAHDPDRRYQTAGDLASDIRRSLDGAPIEAKRDSRWYVLRKGLWRHRVWVAVACIFLAMIVASVTGLGVLYSQQVAARREADTQRERAEQRFDEVRTLTNAVIREIDPIIRRIPGTASARRTLAKRSREYLDNLARIAGDDVSLLVEVGRGYITIGNSLGDPANSNSADPDAAIAEYRSALVVFERAASIQPRDFEVLMGLQESNARIGSLLRDLQQYDEAVAHLETSLQFAEQAASIRPSDLRPQRGRFSTMERLAEIAGTRGDAETARQLTLQANAIASATAAAHPDDVWLRRDAIVGHAALGDLATTERDFATALQHYQRFLEEVMRLRTQVPDALVVIRDVASAHQHVGGVQQRIDDLEAAAETYRRGIDALGSTGAMEGEPDLQRLRLSLMVKRTECLLALRQFDDVAPLLERLLRDAAATAWRAPNHPRIQRTLAVAHYKAWEYHRAMAQADNTLDRTGHVEAASAALHSVIETFADIEARGLLLPEDAGVADALRSELQAWESEPG
jgi:tRNA A-37 threonylcarbamoyl transferase component Bud32/tetratricopeptide (TPR) repeat protein